MYLFTLVFIFLTILGLFTEVVAMQNCRFVSRQVNGAQQILIWHGAMLQAARYRYPTAADPQVFPTWGAVVPNDICSVSVTGYSPTKPCTDNALSPSFAKLDSLVVNSGAPPITNLIPAGYTTRFNNVIYNAGTGTRLAVTYLLPGTADDDPLPPIGISASELVRQLIRMGVDRGSFGYVVGGAFTPISPTAGGVASYTVPPVTPPITDGTFAIFTAL